MLIDQQTLLSVTQRIPPPLDLLRAGVGGRDRQLVDAPDVRRVDTIGLQACQRAVQEPGITLPNLLEHQRDCLGLGDGAVAQLLGRAVIGLLEGLADLVVDGREVMFQRFDVPRGRALGFGQHRGDGLQIGCNPRQLPALYG